MKSLFEFVRARGEYLWIVEVSFIG